MTNKINGPFLAPQVKEPALFRQPNGWEILEAHRLTMEAQQPVTADTLHMHDETTARISRLLQSGYGVGEGTVIEVFPRGEDDLIGHGLTTGVECRVEARASIGFHCTMGDHVTVERDAIIGPEVTIGDDVVVGAGNEIPACVTIESGVQIPEGYFTKGSLNPGATITAELVAQAAAPSFNR